MACDYFEGGAINDLVRLPDGMAAIDRMTPSAYKAHK